MSELARAVAQRLRTDDVDEIEGLLRAMRVSTSATVPTPVRLRAEHVAFRGTKLIRPCRPADQTPGPPADKELDTVLFRLDDAAEEQLDAVPFTFSWTLGPGLYGVGSQQNLRGKTSVLEVIRWALRGRSKLQDEVQRWIEHVTVGFLVNEEHLIVDFDVQEGMPSGAVVRQEGDGSRQVELAKFSGHEDFEATMDAVMMPRLQLQPISSWNQANSTAVENDWVAYAGALTISSKGLEILLGDTQYSGMPSRLLQMFIGAAWAASRAEATTAVKEIEAAIARQTERASEQERLLTGGREQAQQELARAQAELDALPLPGRRLELVSEAVSRAAALGGIVAQLRAELDNATTVVQQTRRALQEERTRRQAQLEDALARRFFHALTPTACPRCAAPVTAQRRAQEARGHECSVCTEQLDLAAYEQDVLLAATAPDDERESALAEAELSRHPHGPTSRDAAGHGPDGDTDDEDDSGEVDAEDALNQILGKAIERVAELERQLAERETERSAAVAAARFSDDETQRMEQRRSAELAVARVAGAAAALAPITAGGTPGDLEELRRRLKVAKAANAITTEWVQDAEREPLKALSRSITQLAREFGMEQLSLVELTGRASMKVHKGGKEPTYSKCEPGEQLRLKVATAVALLRAGFATGVGRHPGLLMIDSPGSEEVDKTNLDSMLKALREAADASQDMQVIIATTASRALTEFVDPANRRVAPDGEYLW